MSARTPMSNHTGAAVARESLCTPAAAPRLCTHSTRVQQTAAMGTDRPSTPRNVCAGLPDEPANDDPTPAAGDGVTIKLSSDQVQRIISPGAATAGLVVALVGLAAALEQATAATPELDKRALSRSLLMGLVLGAFPTDLGDVSPAAPLSVLRRRERRER